MNSEILVEFKGDTKNLDKATASAKNSTNKFSESLKSGLATSAKIATAAIVVMTAAAVSAAKGIWKAANEVAEYGDEIDKTSQKVGLSTDAYQKWDYAMKISGTSMKDCTVGLKTMTNKIDDALNGSKNAVKQFNDLGISVDDLKGKTREDIFATVVSSLQNVQDETKKAALANDLFGRSGQNLLPLFNMTTEETQKLMEETEKYGMIMSEDAVKSSAAFEDSLTKLQSTMKGVRVGIVSEFLPGITTIMDGFSDLIAGVDGADDKINLGIQDLANIFTTAIPKMVEVLVQTLPTMYEAGANIIMTLIDGVMKSLPTIMPKMAEVMVYVVKSFIKYIPEISKASVLVITTFAQGIGEALPELIPEIVNVVIELVETLIENVDLLIDAAVALVTGLIEGIINALPILIEKAPEIVIKLVEAIIRAVPKLLQAAWKIITTLATAIVDNFPKIVEAAKQIPGKLRDGIISALGKIGDVGMNLVKGIWNGINNATQWIIDKIKGFGKKIVNGIKNIFGIHSPSVVMKEQIGVNLGLGVIKGIDATQKEINKEVGNMYDNITGVMNPIIKSGTLDTSVSPTLTNNASTHFSPVVNVVVNNDMEIDPLGQVVSNIKTFSGGAKNDYNYGVGR